MNNTSKIAACAVACSILLTACQNSSPSAPNESATTTATPTSTYTLPATFPAAIDPTRTDTNAAVDFSLAFFDTLNVGQAKNDADPLRAISAGSCFTCMELVKEIELQKNAKAKREGAVTTIQTMGTREKMPDQATYVFDAVLERTPGTLKAEDGRTQELPKGKDAMILTVQVANTGDGDKKAWMMMNMVRPPIVQKPAKTGETTTNTSGPIIPTQ